MRFSKFSKFLLIGLVCSTIHSCKNYPTFNQDYTRIETGPGPEDMALDTFGFEGQIIISCSERRLSDCSKNGLYSYSLVKQEIERLPIVSLPSSIQFRPHGIDIGLVNGQTLLYCVNHEKNEEQFPPSGRQSILIFELSKDTVRFKEQLIDDILISPNDVCVDNKGGIYVSNDSGSRNNFFEKLLELRKSTVVHFNGENWKYVGDKFKYANGVGVRNNQLFVTGTQEKTIYNYQINKDGTLFNKQTLPALKGNDNISFYGDKLVTTAHLDFMKFLKHVKDEPKPSPCAVYTVGINSSEIDTLYLDNGNILSAASTALIYEDKLYVSQVFNPFVLEIPLKN